MVKIDEIYDEPVRSSSCEPTHCGIPRLVPNGTEDPDSMGHWLTWSDGVFKFYGHVMEAYQV